MPTFNLTPILFPKPKQDDVYDMLKDLLQIKEKQLAIGEGGEIQNPATYDALIQEYEAIINNPSIDANDRRDAEKQMNSLIINKLKTDLDQKKQIDSGDLKQMVNQDLRELEFEFPGNPIAYATGAMMKYNDVLYGTAEREGLNQLISILETNATDVSSLREYQLTCQEELSKFSDIMDAYETGDMNRLSEYAVVYTPYAGKAKAMQIIFRGGVDPNHSQPTNLRYSRDSAGNLSMVADTGEPTGMQVYFIRANAVQGDRYSFGNQQFTLGINNKWEAENATAFDYRKVKHAPLHSLPSGSFVRDSKDKLFYVNRDRSFFPVRDVHKEELGFSEDKVYNLSPDEELNILPGAIDHTTFPVIERYNRESSMSDFNYWDAFKESLGAPAGARKVPVPEGMFRGVKTVAAKVGEVAGGYAASLREDFRTWGRGLKDIGRKIKETPLPRPTSWGLEDTKPLKTIEESKKFIEATPKY